ncbi:MAG: hypothetical protein AAF533_07850 [Acidobacteriota bacterium]
MMRSRSLLVSLGLALCLGTASPATAWTEKFHQQVAEQSARLMPASLQSILARHSGRLAEGAAAPLVSAGDPRLYLHAGGSHGSLDRTVLLQTQRILDQIQGRAPMESLAYEFGILSHYVALAQDPLHSAADDPREAQWAGNFLRFAESRLDRYKIVFPGYYSEPLQRDDVTGFIHSICNRSRRHYPTLARAHVDENGQVRQRPNFSDRHPVYGVASLAYSRSVTDTARLWLYVWVRAGGDASNLPVQPGTSSVMNAGAQR